jgi:hypothetical protein
MLGLDMIIVVIFFLAVGFFSGMFVQQGLMLDYKDRWKKAIAILDDDGVAEALLEHNVWVDKANGKTGELKPTKAIEPIGISSHYRSHTEHQKLFMEKLRKEKEDALFRAMVNRYERDRRKELESFYASYAYPPIIYNSDNSYKEWKKSRDYPRLPHKY